MLRMYETVASQANSSLFQCIKSYLFMVRDKMDFCEFVNSNFTRNRLLIQDTTHFIKTKCCHQQNRFYLVTELLIMAHLISISFCDVTGFVSIRVALQFASVHPNLPFLFIHGVCFNTITSRYWSIRLSVFASVTMFNTCLLLPCQCL